MRPNALTACCVAAISVSAIADDGGRPSLAIAERGREVVPLFEALPVNDCFVTCLVTREKDDVVFGATCGKKRICLFSFDAKTSVVRQLDCFEALWWDEPRIALGPDGSIYLAARRAHDKQFAFERLRERAQTPDSSYKRRDVVPLPDQINEKAPGMPIRHYGPDGKLRAEILLPESLREDGVGALVACAGGKILCGLTSPGGHLFTIGLDGGETKDHGAVVRFANHHHTRRISRVLMPGNDGLVYICGSHPDAKPQGEHGEDGIMGVLLAFNPQTAELEPLDARVPAVVGRRRFAGVDAAARLPDGSFLGGTTDGYLFRFDPERGSVEGFGKPLRQHNICGLARGADGWVYGVGGEPGGLPRLFAFDPQQRRLVLGMSPTANAPDGGASLFGDIGAIAATSDGTLVCGERERRAYLVLYRAGSEPSSWRSVFEGEALTRCTRDRFTDFAADSRVVQLAPTYLISDTMGRSIRVGEALGQKAYARKVITLDRPCREVQLLLYGGGGTVAEPMLIRVNRDEILHVQEPEKMLTGGWDRQTIPGAFLRVGPNDFVFGRAGSLIVDTDAPGANSFKAPQRWGPWKNKALGPDNDAAGEYVVRMRVRGYAARGVVTSPVIDVASLGVDAKKPPLTPIVGVARLRLRAEADTPPRTAVRLEARAGTTPDVESDAWSVWVRADAIAADLPRQRFIQWRAILTSRDTDVTPRLRKVVVEATGEISGANHEQVKITAAPDNEIVVSSYPFDYADPNPPRMRHLRDKYNLEEVIAPGKTETEKFALLRTWVRKQWEGWNKNKYNYCPQWDALEILEMAPANLGLGMCTHYAAVFTQCAATLGYHARVLIVDHHCLTEIWSDEHGKWILQDPGLLAGHPIAFQYEVDGKPINALEMHRRSLAGNADDMKAVPEPPIPQKEMRDKMVRLFVRFAIPLRNDHLYRSEPQELAHGFGQYHWDGYLWWTDSLDPKYPEYSLLTNRPEDFYWTLNKTRIGLQDTETAGVLSVDLSGPIPNLDKFMVRIGDGEWKASSETFEWKLEKGKNTLEAKAVNVMGVAGPVNRVELEYSPG